MAERRESPLARGLNALAGVRLAADPVHGNGQVGMGLPADRAKAHGTGGEPLDDLGGGLDLVQAERGLRIAEPHEAPEGQVPLGLVIDGLGEGLILVREVAAHCMLQARDGFWRPGVGLTPQPVGVGSADVEHVGIDRGIAIGVAMPADRLFGDLN